jgi:uncharacterized protein (TIGR03435 family)
MTIFAGSLARLLGRSVVDKTELTGAYNFKLEWAPDEFQVPGPSEISPTADPSGPSIFTALQDQVGLRLEPGKGPVEVLVVDDAQKPAETEYIAPAHDLEAHRSTSLSVC